MDERNNLYQDCNNSNDFSLKINSSSKFDGASDWICPPPPNPKPDHLRAKNNPILRNKIFSALSSFRFKRMKVVKSISEMPIDSKIHKGETPGKIKEAMQFFSLPASDYVGNSFNPYKKSKNLGLIFRGSSSSSASSIKDEEAVIHNFSQIMADTV